MSRRWVRITVSVAPMAVVFICGFTFWLTWVLSMLALMPYMSWWVHGMAITDANRMAEWWADNEGHENSEHDQTREPDL